MRRVCLGGRRCSQRSVAAGEAALARGACKEVRALWGSRVSVWLPAVRGQLIRLARASGQRNDRRLAVVDIRSHNAAAGSLNEATCIWPCATTYYRRVSRTWDRGSVGRRRRGGNRARQVYEAQVRAPLDDGDNPSASVQEIREPPKCDDRSKGNRWIQQSSNRSSNQSHGSRRRLRPSEVRHP
jgi:hypothetical protein